MLKMKNRYNDCQSITGMTITAFVEQFAAFILWMIIDFFKWLKKAFKRLVLFWANPD